MSTKDFLLPDLGEGLTEGEVVSWMVAVGDVVEVDQYLAEIETAKAVVEVPSPFAGTILTLHAEPGEEVEVGKPLVTFDVGGEDGGAGESADQPAQTGAADPAPVAEGAASDSQAADSEEDDGGSGNVLVGYGTSGGKGSRRRRGGARAGVGTGVGAQGSAAGSAEDGGPGTVPEELPAGDAVPPTTTEAPSPAADSASSSGASSSGASSSDGSSVGVVERDGRPMAKPPVRKMAKDLGVDLASIAGTGKDGIITRADVQAAADRVDAPAPVDAGVPETAGREMAATPSPAPEPIANPTVTDGGRGQTRVPMGQMRKTIAAQMSRSRREIPEAVTWVEADATPLMKLRKTLNQGSGPDAVKISPLAIIMRMAVAGLRAYPTLNASLDTTSDEIVMHGHVNLGFAAQTDRGLVVPVIRDTDALSIPQLAAQLNGMAATARAGKLSPADMTGGTFTVSNYGAFGVDGGDMVINHPEAAILGVGRIARKPWVVDGKVKVRQVITYSVAFDHRICDGGEGAGFIRLLADMTEDPATLLASL